MRCIQPGCNQQITPDGYHGWVHRATYLYACYQPTKKDPNPPMIKVPGDVRSKRR